jgi:hypothetical protein
MLYVFATAAGITIGFICIMLLLAFIARITDPDGF